MACEKPITAYRPATGGPLRFTPPNPDRDPRSYEAMKVPCGTCILCRQEYARQTAIRLTHEATLHDKNCFLTLTYDDTHLPEYGSLNYEHLAGFWKRLRIDLLRRGAVTKHSDALRYYAVGEYGDRSLRAHYHACIFGQDFKGSGEIQLREGSHSLWTNLHLQRLWGFGNVSVGVLNFATARYTASYVVKKLRQKQKYVRIDPDTGELIPLVQPRAFMSRNLGKGWWLQWGHQLADHDRVIVEAQEQKPPKAYDKWLAEKDQKRALQIKARRKELAKPLTPEEARARALNAHARVGKKSKKV